MNRLERRGVSLAGMGYAGLVIALAFNNKSKPRLRIKRWHRKITRH